ncbi:MAG: phosphatase PAP2 family protein [Bacteroidaceae bacterium]
MLDQLITLDQTLLLAWNGSDSLFMDGLMWTLTQTLTWIPLLMGLVIMVFKNQRPSTGITIILCAILLVIFTDQISSSLCKPYFHRLRPTHTPGIADAVDLVNGYRGGMYGFFSSHAANSFGAAMFFTLVFRHTPTSLILFAWASLSSYTRIYLGVHYPFDILCGTIFGILSGTLFWFICKKACGHQSSYSDYNTSFRTSTGYVKSSFSTIFLMTSISLTYALIRANMVASWL